MKIEDVKQLQVEERYLYWIKERTDIYNRRKAGKPKPWTDDEIMLRYKFCNVRRMNDRVSQWLYTNWYKPMFNHPNMVIAAVLARQLNNTEALASIGFPSGKWEPNDIEAILNSRALQGLKNFSGAYMITGTLGGTKVHQIIQKVVTPIYRAIQSSELVIDCSSMETTWALLCKYPGFGSFIAGQVVADLRWAMKGTWKDKFKWAPKGPGSRRGINRLLGIPKGTSMTQAKFNVEFDKVIHLCDSNLPAYVIQHLEAIDFQNTLCEFDKYERTLWEGRRPKQLYQGTPE